MRPLCTAEITSFGEARNRERVITRLHETQMTEMRSVVVLLFKRGRIP